MKKQLLTLILILIAGVTTITLYFLYKSKNNNVELPIVSVNGKEFGTTGAALLNEDQSIANDEMLSLLDVGLIEQNSFRIITPGNGSVVVELNPPYEESKLNLLKWLRDNGFEHIDPETLIYKNITSP